MAPLQLLPRGFCGGRACAGGKQGPGMPAPSIQGHAHVSLSPCTPGQCVVQALNRSVISKREFQLPYRYQQETRILIFYLNYTH